MGSGHEKTRLRGRLRWPLIIGLLLLVTSLTLLRMESMLQRAEMVQLKAHGARFACWTSVRASCPDVSAAMEDAVACPQVRDTCRERGFDVVLAQADVEHARLQRWVMWTRLSLIAISLAMAFVGICVALRRTVRGTTANAETTSDTSSH